MHRLTLALLLGCVVLLLSYVNAPAALTPAPARVTTANLAEIDASAPLVQDVAQQAERLRARLAAAPDEPVTRRDPFTFGSRPGPAPSSDTAAATPEAEAADTAPAITWPTLVALLTDRGEAEVRATVLAIGDGLEILNVGEAAGGFRVRAITATSVEILHVATSTVTRLSIR